MENKITIMGLNIDIIDYDNFKNIIKKFLDNEGVNIIYWLSLSSLDNVLINKSFNENVNNMDMVLATDDIIVTINSENIYNFKNKVINYEYFKKLIQDISKDTKKEYTALFITDKEKSIIKFSEYFNNIQDNIKILKSYQVNLDNISETEILINEINTYVPDILIFGVSSPIQEKWLFENKAKLNTKVCFVVGEILKELQSVFKPIPNWIKVLRLEKVYAFLTKKNRLKIIKKHTLKKQLEQYNLKNNKL